ncbi:MAG: hypothetical protein WKG01_34375 [Kofleriaceae bacterium]
MKLRASGLVVCAVFGCNTIKEMFKPGTVSGRMESKGELGDWVMDKGLCYSGENEKYFGALAVGPDESGIAIKLVKDPTKGWQVMVNNATTCAGSGAEKSKCSSVVLNPEHCKKLEADVVTTNMTINNVKVVNGKVTLDCAVGTSTIRGELTLDHCH